MKTLIWLDDFRDPFKDNWIRYSPIGTDCDIVWVKTYQEFVDQIMCCGLPDGICFDHDLGTHNGNGYECAKFLVDYCINNNVKLPLYAIQSANPIGKENIDSLLKNYIKNCELNMRKVYCKALLNEEDQLCWAFKDDSIKNYIPDVIYKVGNSYEMLEIKTKAIFKRWATSFDL